MVFLIRDISFTCGGHRTLSCPSHPSSDCLTCLSHLFSDILPQFTQDLVEDDELTNQSFGVVT